MPNPKRLYKKISEDEFNYGFAVSMSCPYCGETILVKSGRVRGKQRYYCKACKKNFVIHSDRGPGIEIREKIILRYLRSEKIVRVLQKKSKKKNGNTTVSEVKDRFISRQGLYNNLKRLLKILNDSDKGNEIKNRMPQYERIGFTNLLEYLKDEGLYGKVTYKSLKQIYQTSKHSSAIFRLIRYLD